MDERATRPQRLSCRDHGQTAASADASEGFIAVETTLLVSPYPSVLGTLWHLNLNSEYVCSQPDTLSDFLNASPGVLSNT